MTFILEQKDTVFQIFILNWTDLCLKRDHIGYFSNTVKIISFCAIVAFTLLEIMLSYNERTCVFFY